MSEDIDLYPTLSVEQLLIDIGKSDSPDEAQRWARAAVAKARKVDVERLRQALDNEWTERQLDTSWSGDDAAEPFRLRAGRIAAEYDRLGRDGSALRTAPCGECAEGECDNCDGCRWAATAP